MSFEVGNGFPAALGDEALEVIGGFDDDFGHKASSMVGMVDACCELVEVWGWEASPLGIAYFGQKISLIWFFEPPIYGKWAKA